MRVHYPKLRNIVHPISLLMFLLLPKDQTFIFYLGHPSRKHQDWFDDDDEKIHRVLEEKHRLNKAHHEDTSSVSKETVYSNQTKLRDMSEKESRIN